MIFTLKMPILLRALEKTLSSSLADKSWVLPDVQPDGCRGQRVVLDHCVLHRVMAWGKLIPHVTASSHPPPIPMGNPAPSEAIASPMPVAQTFKLSQDSAVQI